MYKDVLSNGFLFLICNIFGIIELCSIYIYVSCLAQVFLRFCLRAFSLSQTLHTTRGWMPFQLKGSLGFELMWLIHMLSCYSNLEFLRLSCGYTWPNCLVLRDATSNATWLQYALLGNCTYNFTYSGFANHMCIPASLYSS